MEIEIKGHSGCEIDVVNENGTLVLHKSTNDSGYFNRLVNQIIKQDDFVKTNQSDLKAPKVFGIKKEPNKITATMEYIYSQSFVDFFEYSGVDKIDSFVNSIITFIESELDNSTMTMIDNSIVKNKYGDVKSKIDENISYRKGEISLLLNKADVFFKREYYEIPIGLCHGDFTFSNILFSGGIYYAIDFLDSFIESPLIDIVKIRQDSKYGWSYLMYNDRYDESRSYITLKYIDDKIDNYFSKYKFYCEYYKSFQILNILRILQYAKRNDVIDYLVRTLVKVLDCEK